MDDTKDQNNLSVKLVKNPVFAVDGAANVFAEVRLSSACTRMTTEQIENFVKAHKITVSDNGTELIIAEFPDIYQIGACSGA